MTVQGQQGVQGLSNGLYAGARTRARAHAHTRWAKRKEASDPAYPADPARCGEEASGPVPHLLVEMHADLRATRQILENVLAVLADRSNGAGMGNEPRTEAPPLSGFLTASEVARELRCHVRTLRAMVRAGEFPEPIHVGRFLRWRRATVEAWKGAQA